MERGLGLWRTNMTENQVRYAVRLQKAMLAQKKLKLTYRGSKYLLVK
jgi:hypothetical protein